MSEIVDAPPPPLANTRAKTVPLPRSLSVWTGYLLNRAAQQCRDYFNGLVEAQGINSRHFSVLALLDEEPGLVQIEMGERLGIDRNTMVLLLNDLERLGCVERQRDPRDRRAYVVTLTAKGRDVLTHGTEAARRTNDEIFAPLSPEERIQLRTLLNRLF